MMAAAGPVAAVLGRVRGAGSLLLRDPWESSRCLAGMAVIAVERLSAEASLTGPLIARKSTIGASGMITGQRASQRRLGIGGLVAAATAMTATHSHRPARPIRRVRRPGSQLLATPDRQALRSTSTAKYTTAVVIQASG
jgi:hypothetical protein